MQSERISLPDLLAPSGRNDLVEISKRIERGAVFIYPTETVYGIGGRCDSKEVFSRVIAAKVRHPDNPMILIAGSMADFAPLALTIPPAAKKFADAFWPGMLTLVLPGGSVPEGIAIRVSDHPFIVALAGYFKVPLFSTSANVSGEPYNPDPDVIFERVGGRVDFMLDAGTLPVSLPSTIVRVTEDNNVAVLREGCITRAAVEAVVASGG